MRRWLVALPLGAVLGAGLGGGIAVGQSAAASVVTSQPCGGAR
jgi:hypothetical protein